MRTYKKPLGRSIAAGCIMFTTILFLAMSILGFFNQRKSLYLRYQSFITDILEYVDAHIDDEDLKRCIETKEESETYKETLRFMDEMMNSFDIHYLYAIKPLNLNETHNVMSVFSAEDYHNRYEDTEGNLYLGWVSDDEYDAKTVQRLFEAMEQDDVTFFVERTEWSTDYTGAKPLRDSNGEAYALLAVDVDITTLYRELWSRVLKNAGVILSLGVLYTIAFLSWAKNNIIDPVMLLEKGVVDYADRSHGQRSVDALRFDAPNIQTDNEVESLSKAITLMTENMQGYVSDILSAEERTRNMKQLADLMSELAIVDALTGIGNKTAYTREVEELEQELAANKDLRFGMAMIDLNYLKLINDTYGHEAGDEAIHTLANIACSVFVNSPVFRIGGDEFIVILRGQDYRHAEALKREFIRQTSGRVDEGPGGQVSASIGVALYDKSADALVSDVVKRADEAMYAMKREMKATRADSDLLLQGKKE